MKANAGLNALAALFWLLATGCGKHDAPASSGGSDKADKHDSANKPALDDEPKEPPPPPLVKAGEQHDCKTSYVPRPTRDPNPMCKVPGGSIVMTDPDTDPDHPDSMKVQLSLYYIDEFEVTVAQVAFYLNATHGGGCKDSDPKELGRSECFDVIGPEGKRTNLQFVRKLANGTYQAEPGLEHRPYVLINRQGAKHYCEWAGKTLPTEPQWEFAARHDPTSGKDLLYPWGNAFDGKRARCDIEECPDGIEGNEPVDVGTFDGTHGHSDGRSPIGAFDMAGNASEIVADCEYRYSPCNGDVCVDPPPHDSAQCSPIERGGGIQGARQLRTTNRAKAVISGFRCSYR